MNVVAFAYSGFGCVGLDALVRAGAQVRLVFSHADAPGENIWWPSVTAWCTKHGVPLLLDADLRDAAVAARIQHTAPDFFFSFYYRRLIPTRILALAARGGFNLHGSLLPRYRGRAPLNWQLVHGERLSGLTLHRMEAGADTGDIVAQVPLEIGSDDDAQTVVNRLLALAPGFLDAALAELFAGRAVPRAQDAALATTFGARRPADGAIDWTRSARAVHNLVRAVSRPFPGAFTWDAGATADQVMIWRTRVACDHGCGGDAGTVRSDGLVACGEGLIEVLDATVGTASSSRPLVLRPGQRLLPRPPTHLESA